MHSGAPNAASPIIPAMNKQTSPQATAPDPELLSALKPWLERAASQIERRFTDAKAHAAADHLPVARQRLKELWAGLTRHVSDGRAAFYHDAFRRHRKDLDTAIHRTEVVPDTDGEQ